MKKIKFYLLPLIIVAIFSCKKKSYPAESVIESESPFYFNAIINSAPVSLKVGANNYYMFSSNTKDSNSVYNFNADLKRNNCTTCNNSLQIKINDFKVSALNASTQIDSSLIPKLYFFNGTPLYVVQFKSIFNKTASSYLWNFGDNQTSTLANPTHTYNAASNYSISLRINSNNFCQQYISNIEKINFPAKNCKITVVSDSVKSISFASTVQGMAPFNYLWQFGDGSIATTANPTHTYINAGTYPITLRVIDAANDTSFAKYNTATLTNPMPCLTNYSITSISQIADALALSKITINYTDDLGVTYTSNNILQPSTSYFKIISVEDYDLNEKNEKTKKIKVQFKCNVYNGTALKTIDNAEAVIAISYK